MSLFDKVENSVDLHNDFTIFWSVNNVGFGTFYFYEKDGQIYCQNESMNKDFIKKVLCDMVDQAILEDE